MGAWAGFEGIFQPFSRMSLCCGNGSFRKEGSLRCRLHGRVAVFLGQPQNGLSFTQVAHGVIPQDSLDQGLGLGADRSCLCSAIGGCRHEISEFAWRIIRQIGHEGTGDLDWLWVYQRLIEKCSTRLSPTPNPDALPMKRVGNEKYECRIQYEMIGMNRTAFAKGTFIRLGRQRLDAGLLLLENLKRALLRRAVDLHADLLFAPDESPFLGFVDIAIVSACHQPPAYNRYNPFHFPFVFGRLQLGGIGNKTIMPLQLA